jgi:hypothetical protein
MNLLPTGDDLASRNCADVSSLMPPKRDAGSGFWSGRRGLGATHIRLLAEGDK